MYGLDEVTSSKPEVVEALILIGLLSLVVSRTLRELFIDIIEQQRSNSSGDDVDASSLLPKERWARAFSRRSDRILRRVAERLGYEPPSLVESLLNDALEPNAHRALLMEQIAQALTPGGSYGSFRVSIWKIETSIFRAVATIAI